MKRRGTYTICKNPSEIDEEIGAKSDDQDDGEEEGELSDLEDFTLRTVESLEVDAMLDKFSPIKGQIISECLFDVLNFPKISEKFDKFLP